MADINIAYLEVRLSGGVANANPDLSLGGEVSSERVLAQSHTALSNITGVTIQYASGNPTGAGTLTYNDAANSLTWAANGESAGAAVIPAVDGRYLLKSGVSGFLLIEVVAASLPGANQSDSVTIANIANETFDDVARQESFTGDTEYRCLYVKNNFDGTSRSVSSITRSGSVATVTTAAPHGYVTNQSVQISGAVETEYNGTFVITVTGADTFTYTVTGTPATPATGTIVCRNTDPFLDIVAFITLQPTPGTISIGKDPAGPGDGVKRSVASITRSGSVATVTTGTAHGYNTGNSVKIEGATQTEYNGTFTITVTGATTFTYTVSGSPATPATGTITSGRGVAVTVANENTAPAGVTFTTPTSEGAGVSLGQLNAGEVAAIWVRRTIPVKNTITSAESLSRLAFQTYY